MMTEKQVCQARDALAAWFESQNLMPAEASLVMSSLLAQQFVKKTKDVQKLQSGVNAFAAMLACDIVLEIRS